MIYFLSSSPERQAIVVASEEKSDWVRVIGNLFWILSGATLMASHFRLVHNHLCTANLYVAEGGYDQCRRDLNILVYQI